MVANVNCPASDADVTDANRDERGAPGERRVGNRTCQSDGDTLISPQEMRIRGVDEGGRCKPVPTDSSARDSATEVA
jgi:hypothetical protein